MLVEEADVEGMLVRLYIRTFLSEKQVARRGRVGCGVVCQARVGDGGVRVARRERGGGG